MKIQNSKIKIQKSRGSKFLNLKFLILNSRKSGFTLIELIVTMVLISIVAFIVADAMSTGFKTYFTTDNRKESLDQARIAMERMTREIRNLRDSSSVIASSPTQFNFTDIDGNAINFIWTSPNITRNADTLATSITSLLFEYVDNTGGVVVGGPFVAGTTRRIRITITATKNNESVTLQSEVWPRSL